MTHDIAATAERLRDDPGVVSVMFAVLGFAIFAALALVVDGGRQLGALSEAQNIADNAARSGAQAVDQQAWRTLGDPTLDEAEARAAVAAYFAQWTDSGRVVPGPVTVVGTTVTVEVTVNRRQFFFPTRPATAIESADALDGVLEANP